MIKNAHFSLILLIAAAGCSGGSNETNGAADETTAGSESPAGTSAASVIARYEGLLAEALPMVIELNDAGGGTVTYPDSGRSFTLSSCVGDGPTLRCSITADGVTGDIELTHREGGTTGRLRQDTDGEWADFSADQVEL